MLKTITLRVKAYAVIFAVAAGFLAVSAIFISTVYAQETESAASAPSASSDIPEKLLPLAEELGCTTKAACASSFTANFSKGLELAEKYNVYNVEQKTLAKSFKQEVLIKLADASEADFEQKIIEIAGNLVKNNPNLAKQMGVDKKEIKAAQTIITELKSVGANLAVCSRPADTLAREELITCLNASRKLADKASEVSVYIPEKNLTTASNVLNLEESLRRGEYGNLGLTADEVGIKCLRPDSPEVCDEIATKFFGEQGVKMLQQARAQVTETEQFYRQNAKEYTLTTPNGQTFVGKDAIGAACKRAFEEKNVALARICGNFAVKNGFATQEEVDRSLKLVQAVVDKNINFDVCAQNPAACNNYIPVELRNEFDVMQKIDSIMRQETGFDPMQCQQSAMNPEIGKKCLEASRRALPQIEAISVDSEKARQIIMNIKKQITLGETMMAQKENIKQELTINGGPGGCKNDEECNKFCAKPENGPECLAFGANKGFYKADELTQRFEMYYNPQPTAPTNYMQPIESRQQYPTLAPGTFPNSMTGGMGPSPECLAAIQAGNFEKAKQICSISQTTVNQIQTPVEQYQQPYQPQPCPMIFPAPCPTGQHREQKIINNCPVFSACVSDQGIGIQPSIQQQPCVQVPPCPSGQYHPTEFNGCLKSECVVSQWQQPVIPTNQGACAGSQIRCYSQSSPEGWCQLPPCPPSMICTPAGGDCCSGAPADPDCGVVTQPAVGSCFGGQVWCKNASGGGWCQMPPCPVITNICPSDQTRCYGPGSPDGWCQAPPCPPMTPTTPTACAGSQVRCFSYANPQGWCQMPPCPVEPSTQTCPSGNVRCTDSAGGSWCQMPPCPTTTVCPSNQIRCYNSSTPNGWCQTAPCPSTTTPTTCSSDQVRCYSGTSDTVGWCQMSPCPSTVTQPVSGGVRHIWTFKDGQTESSILSRTDSEYSAFISRIDAQCRLINKSQFFWLPNAGNSSPENWQNFGIPDCSGTTTVPPTTIGSCTGGQTWCASSSGGGWCQMPPCPPAPTVPPATCANGQVRCYSGTSDTVGWCQMSPCPPMTPTTSCSAGQYWYTPPEGGTGYCRTYTTPVACTGSQIRCYSSGSPDGWCQAPPCPVQSTETCPSGNVRCTDSAGGSWCQMPPCPTTTVCPSNQIRCYNSSTPNGWCQTAPCPSTTTPTTCSSDQVRCYSGTSDTVGWCQMSPCPPMTPTTPTTCSSDQVKCYSGSGDSTGWCQMPPCPTTTTPTTCSSGNYWSGTACVPSTPPACPSGNYWDGNACVPTTPPPTTPPPAPSTSCSSNQYWNGSACVDSTPPPGGITTCTSAGGDCCDGSSSDPDCGSVTPPPTTPPPTEPPPPPPPTEPPPPVEPPPPSSILPLIRSSLANTLEQISIILREMLQSLIR